MAAYTENDVQNALADFQNEVTLAITAIKYEVLYIILCNHLNSA